MAASTPVRTTPPVTPTPPPPLSAPEATHPTALAIEQARVAVHAATAALGDKTEALDTLTEQYRAAVLAHDGDAMARLTRELDDQAQRIVAAKIGAAHARVALLSAEIADAERQVADALAVATSTYQAVITITEEVHPHDRVTMGGDPDRNRRYNQACAANGEAAHRVASAKDRANDLARQRANANGELHMMIERVAVRARRDITA